MSGFSASATAEPGDALIRVPGRADLAAKPSLMLTIPDLGARAFRPAAISAEGPDLVMRVGPEITERLEAGTHYDVVLPNAGIEPVRGNVRWPDVQPRIGGMRKVFVGPDLPGPKTLPTGISPPEPEVGERPPPPIAPLGNPIRMPPPAPIIARRRPWRWLVPIGIGAAGLATVGWWALMPRPPMLPSTSIAGRIPLAPSSVPSPAPTPSPVDSLASLTVPDVISHAADAAAIRREADRRLANGHPDDGELLLEAAAKQGDSAAMARLGALYDPVGFDPKGPIPSPDARQAARYYREAADAGDTGVATQREKLHDWLTRQAQGGDLSASLALKDFWQ